MPHNLARGRSPVEVADDAVDEDRRLSSCGPRVHGPGRRLRLGEVEGGSVGAREATYDWGVIYFCSTQGGGPAEPGPSDTIGGFGNGTGQIWGYDIASGRLKLIFQSPGAAVLDFPDNVTVSNRGTLVLCEDNINDNYLRGLSPDGELWDIALNRLISSTGANRFNDEFAGATSRSICDVSRGVAPVDHL